MYTSDVQVDFRELLKELATVFRCRIELRQIGPRDKAKSNRWDGNLWITTLLHIITW